MRRVRGRAHALGQRWPGASPDHLTHSAGHATGKYSCHHALLSWRVCEQAADVSGRRGGAAALKRLKSGRFDGDISDIDMPNMKGFDLLKAIKADDALKHLPVLMVTAEVRKEDIVMAAQAGAAGYVLKPFSRATLQENVQSIMQRMGAIA